MYRFRPTYQETEYNEENVQRKIINCCNSTMVCICEAHDLCRRKATEVLLFVLTDTDREYSKDKPNAIPVAYALNGKSLKVSTCRQMMNDVRNTMKENGIDILVEAYDGQWSGLVFRDHNNKPLTLFEVQRDSLLQYSGMSKDKLLSFIRNLCIISDGDINTWTSTVISRPGITHIGNIEVKAGIHTKETQNPKHVMHCKRYIEVKSFCNEFNCDSGMVGVIFPNIECRPDLWQVNICDHKLLHMWGKHKLCRRFTQTSNVAISGKSSNLLDEIEHDVMEIDMHDTDSILDNVSENFVVTDSGHIRNLLLTSHNNILIEILFFLLCGKRTEKWSSFHPQDFYNTVFRSSKDIFTELTIHEIDGILKILQKSSCKECPLVVPKKLKKLSKSNILAFVLGHTKRHFLPKKKKIKMVTLKNLCKFEVKRSVPEDVMRVGLASWKFKLDLDEWLNNSPVLITLDIPVAPYTFDIDSYPDISECRSQVEC